MSSSPKPIPAGARKWRVLVMSNSTGAMVPGRTSRDDGNYAEVLERLLRAEGLDAEVRNASKEFELLPAGVYRFQEHERAWSPDVVVAGYGIVDCQAPVLPRFVHNHFQTWNTGLSRPARIYRSRVASKVWPKLRAYQRFACRRLPNRLWRVSPRRFGLALARLITLVRYDHRLLCVLDIAPPGSRFVYSLPHVDTRRDTLQAVVTRVVGEAQVNDPDGVRLIAASAISEDMGIDEATPDGLHWSPEAHRRIAALLADEILRWIKQQ